MSRLKAGLISGLLGLAIAAGVFVAFGMPGSLGVASSKSNYGITAGVDEQIHVGLGPFDPGGPREIKIIKVELVDPSPAIRLDGIRLTLFNQPNAILLTSDKGPREDVIALPEALGTVLKPGQDGGLWVSFTVTATGNHSFEGVRVTYRSGWLTKTTIVGPEVRVRVGEIRGPQGPRTGGGNTGQGRSRNAIVPRG